MSTQQSRIAYIADVRSATDKLLDAIDQLNALFDTWNAGMSAWIVDPTPATETEPATYGDFTAAIGLNRDDLAAVVGTTLSALNALLASGHRTNLEKVR